MLYLTRRYEFPASHRMFNPAFSDAQNLDVYAQCSNPNGHGHNYRLEVTIAGQPDPQTGMVLNIGTLDSLVDDRLIARLDHKHLNFDVPFLADVNPTAENLVVAFWNELVEDIPPPARLYRLRLWETAKNSAEYRGEPLS